MCGKGERLSLCLPCSDLRNRVFFYAKLPQSASLTDWIDRGRIRDVYSVTLGYAAYAAPDRRYPDDETAYEAEYWLAPTWCVECKYAESAARALTADGAEEDETEARGYQQEKGWTILLIDARTGRMIDPEDETTGRYVYAL